MPAAPPSASHAAQSAVQMAVKFEDANLENASDNAATEKKSDQAAASGADSAGGAAEGKTGDSDRRDAMAMGSQGELTNDRTGHGGDEDQSLQVQGECAMAKKAMDAEETEQGQAMGGISDETREVGEMKADGDAGIGSCEFGTNDEPGIVSSPSQVAGAIDNVPIDSAIHDLQTDRDNKVGHEMAEMATTQDVEMGEVQIACQQPEPGPGIEIEAEGDGCEQASLEPDGSSLREEGGAEAEEMEEMECEQVDCRQAST